MVSSDSVKEFLSLLLVKSFRLATARGILEELIFKGGVGDRMVAMIVCDRMVAMIVCDFANLIFYFYFILTLIWLLSHAELLDTSFVDSENLSRNKN